MLGGGGKTFHISDYLTDWRLIFDVREKLGNSQWITGWILYKLVTITKGAFFCAYANESKNQCNCVSFAT